MIICSNLGPTIAFSLACWLRLHTPSLLGACMLLRSSPSATDSCNGLSMLPSLLVGVALVLLTGEGVERSLVSLDGVVGQEGAVGGERAGDAAAEQTAAG
jgi:hypothetical protein